jgi:hypothetical protein
VTWEPEPLDLREYVERLLTEMDRRYQERFEAQTKALDAAFLAQQVAMQAALAAAEKAVSTAMQAAEKAVNKAETAAERRFESVNEFRQQLADQAASFMPRSEAEQRLAAITENYQQLIESQKIAIDAALTAADKAVTKAEIATEKRFESVNEFRGQLADQTKSFITREEFATVRESLTEKIDLLKDTSSATSGRSAGLDKAWGYLIGATGVLIALVLLVLRATGKG